MRIEDVAWVYAWGGMHEACSYEDAVATAEWYRETSVDHGEVGLARVSSDAFELVAMGEDSEGCAIGVDSDYVTLEVGRRLALEGHVVAMGCPDHWPATEYEVAIATFRHLWG